MTDSAVSEPETGYRECFYSAQDGLRLYFRDYGNPTSPQTPVLCLGGLTRNSKDFDTLAERLSADGRRILCPDYRGRGRSMTATLSTITRAPMSTTSAICWSRPTSIGSA